MRELIELAAGMVAAIGYTGFLMGPALIGLLTAALSLSGTSAPSSSRWGPCSSWRARSASPTALEERAPKPKVTVRIRLIWSSTCHCSGSTMWVLRNRVFGLVLAGAILATAILAVSTALAQPLSPHGGGVITVEGSDGLEGFEVVVDGRELPRNLASSRNYFGKPASRRHVGFSRDPECQLRWPSQRVTASFYHGYGGVRSSCAPAAGTLLATFGAGWSTDTGVQVGASVADLRNAYPGAKQHGSTWGLVESYPPWGGAIDVLAAQVRAGRVVSLSVAGPEAWDE